MKLTIVWSNLKNVSLEELEEQVIWHMKCYKDATHSGMINRARQRYGRQLDGPNESKRKSSEKSSELENLPLTR